MCSGYITLLSHLKAINTGIFRPGSKHCSGQGPVSQEPQISLKRCKTHTLGHFVIVTKCPRRKLAEKYQKIDLKEKQILLHSPTETKKQQLPPTGSNVQEGCFSL